MQSLKRQPKAAIWEKQNKTIFFLTGQAEWSQVFNLLSQAQQNAQKSILTF